MPQTINTYTGVQYIMEMVKRLSSNPNIGTKINLGEAPKSNDAVKKPIHYDIIEGIQAIELIARSMTKAQFYGYCLGNIMKYRLRAGKKDNAKQDLEKSEQYVELYEKYKGLCYAETKETV